MKAVLFNEAELLKDYPIKSKVDGWYFSVEEVAIMVWYVKAKDIYGHTMSYSGSDGPEFMIQNCEDSIRELSVSGEYILSFGPVK